MIMDCSRLERKEFLEKLTGKKYTSEELDEMETASLKIEMFGDRCCSTPQETYRQDHITKKEANCLLSAMRELFK